MDVLANRFLISSSNVTEEQISRNKRFVNRRIKSTKCFHNKRRTSRLSNSVQTKQFEKFSSFSLSTLLENSCAPEYSKCKANAKSKFSANVNPNSTGKAFKNMPKNKDCSNSLPMKELNNYCSQSSPSLFFTLQKAWMTEKRKNTSNKSNNSGLFPSNLLKFALSTFVLSLSNFGLNFAECALPPTPLLTIPSSPILHTFLNNVQSSRIDNRYKQNVEKILWRRNPLNFRLSLTDSPSLQSLTDFPASQLQYYPHNFIVINEENNRIHNVYPFNDDNDDDRELVRDREKELSFSSNEADALNSDENDEMHYNSLHTSPKFAKMNRAKTKKNVLVAPQLQESDETQQKLLRIGRNSLMGGPHHQGDNAYQIRNINDIGWFRFG